MTIKCMDCNAYIDECSCFKFEDWLKIKANITYPHGEVDACEYDAFCLGARAWKQESDKVIRELYELFNSIEDDKAYYNLPEEHMYGAALNYKEEIEKILEKHKCLIGNIGFNDE